MYVFTANFASQSLKKNLPIEIPFQEGLKTEGLISKKAIAVLIKIITLHL